MVKLIRLFWLLLVIMLLAGCAAKIPHAIVPEYGKLATRLIAVLPVKDGASDAAAAGALRAKLIEELYFKGYPRIPARAIDAELNRLSAGSAETSSASVIGERLKVDAVLYTTLNESRRGSGILFASTVVDGSFELRSARTGERLWQVHYRAVRRHYGVTRKQVEMQASSVFEEALEELVNRVLETLPDSPEVLSP
jgi:hypothetical protein